MDLREACREGIGRALLESLLSLGVERGFRSVIALIAADQTPSLKLHQRLEFERVGLLREVGYKFDRWLDVVMMQRMLAAPSRAPKPHATPDRKM